MWPPSSKYPLLFRVREYPFFVYVATLRCVHDDKMVVVKKTRFGVYVEAKEGGDENSSLNFLLIEGVGIKNHSIMEGALNCETRFSR